MTDLRRLSLAKPTLQTKFHIDFDWWTQSDQDWRVYLQNLLCLEHQQALCQFSWRYIDRLGGSGNGGSAEGGRLTEHFDYPLRQAARFYH